MQSSAFPGDFYEMIEMMHLGDSAIFYIDAEPFFTTTAGYDHVPDFAKSLDKLLFHLKIMKIQTEEDIEKEMEALQIEMRDGEADRILNYVNKNNIATPPTETGLYVITEEEGNGPKPQKGDKVKVHYTGYLLDGTKFDSSVDRGQPFEFPLGTGRVIKGWDEGIASLNVGSKAKLIIPSSLGYGDRGAGEIIKPYSTLIFDVELLDIVK
ncbi:MAG: FKBP-type peptidyl-prolyl cis-trans isomerase [Bacteroidales bacterium]|nr:FKBP-type peptidyl-prolyl cis-trans isomerase [Bacteroidales bacterium]